ncbi:DinB family protein [Niabella insulamsoli]|uniref:DinB family protein n=1 Tax=Niabella insulamsoli TaxID=3144874 RepID=UPI0031FCE463
MKTIFCTLAFVALCSFTVYAPITQKERAYLLSYRASAKALLDKETKGLSDEQLNWKPNDSTWSIANCVEHITLTEKGIFDWAMTTLKETADPAQKSEVKVSDDQIKAMIEQRTQKAKAPEQLKPGGALKDYQKAMATFKEQSDHLENYIKTTKDDLRDHFAKTPIGTIDTYQMLVFLTAHTRRHTAQIIELKAMPDFPK